MTSPIVDFLPNEASPPLAPDFRGVALAATWTAQHGILRAFRLHGAYQVTVDAAREIGCVPLQRALVVAAAAGLRYAAWNLVGETFVFPDDEQIGGGLVRGYFNADVLGRFAPDAYGRCHVVVALGAALSNVIEIVAT